MLQLNHLNGKDLVQQLQYTVSNPNAIVDDIVNQNQQVYYNFLNGYQVLSVKVIFDEKGVGNIFDWSIIQRSEAENEINEAKKEQRLKLNSIPLLH